MGKGKRKNQKSAKLMVVDRWGHTEVRSVATIAPNSKIRDIPATSSDSDWWASLPSVDTIVKSLAIGGSILYGALFLAYRSFYSDLRITPEELGVNNLYVLARSIAFITLMTCLAGIYVIQWIAVNQWESESTKATTLRYVLFIGIGIMNGLFFLSLEPDNWPSWIIYPYTALIFGPIYLSRFPKQRKSLATIAFVVIAASFSVVFPSVAILGHAEDLATKALRGERVSPYSWAGIPALDVRATPVLVDWVGPTNQRPSQLFGEKKQQRLAALLVGQGSGVAILIVQGRGRAETIRIPLTSVVIVGS